MNVAEFPELMGSERMHANIVRGCRGQKIVYKDERTKIFIIVHEQSTNKNPLRCMLQASRWRGLFQTRRVRGR